MMSRGFIPTRSSNPCPLCSDRSGKCREVHESALHLCMTFTDDVQRVPGWRFLGLSRDRLWGKWLWESGSTVGERQEWRRRREHLRQTERERQAQSLPVSVRDQGYRQLLEDLSLCREDREDLERRGLSEEEIRRGLFRSVAPRLQVADLPLGLAGSTAQGTRLAVGAPGYLIPIPDIDGQIVGMQYRVRREQSGNRYRWLSSAHSSPVGPSPHLSNGELPLGVYRPQQLIRSQVGLCEGHLKPFIAAQRLGQILVGAAAGAFCSSPQQLREYLERLTQEVGSQEIVLYPDAGDTRNPHVMRRWRRLLRELQQLGFSVQIGWWGQSTKADLDIDELDPQQFDQIQHLQPQAWLELARRDLRRAKVELAQQALNQLTHAPTQVLDQRFLPSLSLPEPGGILAVSSPMGTGKTEQLRHLIAQFEQRHPGRKVRQLGYRNGLLRQTGQRLGIDLHLDLEVTESREATHVLINHTDRVSACVDSLLKFDLSNFEQGLLILDEVDALLRHLIIGSTCKANRATLMLRFQEVIRQVLRTGGYVVAMEAELTDLTLNTLKGIAGEFPLQLVVNRYRPQPWQVQVLTGSSSGMIQTVMEQLQQGKRMALPTDALQFGRQLERILAERLPEKRVIRVDSTTCELPLIREMLNDPNEVIEREQPDLLIYSPTMESGCDITLKYFDSIPFYFSHLETRIQCQMLARVRDSELVRWGWVAQADHQDEEGGSLRPETLVRDLRRNAEKAMELTQLALALEQGEGSAEGDWFARLQELCNPHSQSPDHVWVEAWAGYCARWNGARVAMAENLIKALQAQGHQVTVGVYEVNRDLVQARVEAKTALVLEEARELEGTDPEGMTQAQAERTLRSNSAGRNKRLKARKVLLQHRLPGVQLDQAFLFKAILSDRGRLLRGTELLWYCLNSRLETTATGKTNLTGAAAARDQWEWQWHLQTQPFPFLPDLRLLSLKVQLLQELGILDLMGEREFRETDGDLQVLRQQALFRCGEIRSILRLQITQKQTGIQILSKLLKRLGLELKGVRKEGGRGAQVRVYQIVNWNCEARQQILEALDRRQEQRVAVVTTCSIDRSSQEVATDLETAERAELVELVRLASEDGGSLQRLVECLRQLYTPQQLRDLRDHLPGPLQEVVQGIPA